MRKQFLHRDVLKIFPYIRPRTLISWSERGLVKPEFVDAQGRGTERVYSYKNLLQIGMISELLSYKIPFIVVESAMKSNPMKQLLDSENLNTFFWFGRQLVSTDVPMDREPPWVGASGFGTLKDFAKKSTDATSAIVINLSMIKNFVDRQIRRLK